MPTTYNVRRVKQREDAIFNRTAKTMAMLVRVTPVVLPTNTADLFVSDTEPSEATGDLKRYYFRGKFEETIKEEYKAGGYIRSVTAVITVPQLYRDYLASAAYIDPYLDGSRFKKCGEAVVESRLYIIQKIESVSLASLKESPV